MAILQACQPLTGTTWWGWAPTGAPPAWGGRPPPGGEASTHGTDVTQGDPLILRAANPLIDEVPEVLWVPPATQLLVRAQLRPVVAAVAVGVDHAGRRQRQGGRR